MPFIRRPRTTHREPLTPRQQTLLYWGVVVALCLIAGGVSFAGGKYWLGKKLRDVEARTPKSALPAKPAADDASSSTAGNAVSQEQAPPDAPVVRIEAREPTEGEKTDAQQRKAEKRHKSRARSDHSKDEGSGDEAASGKPDSPDEASKGDTSKSGDEGDAKPGKKPKKKPATGGPTE